MCVFRQNKRHQAQDFGGVVADAKGMQSKMRGGCISLLVIHFLLRERSHSHVIAQHQFGWIGVQVRLFLDPGYRVTPEVMLQ